jgi:hypothetical protein
MNRKARGFFGERPLPKFDVDSQVLRRRTRRDVLLFGAGALAALAGAGSLLPQDTLTRLGLRRNMNSPRTTNRKLLHSRTTTTELLPILGISLDGI